MAKALSVRVNTHGHCFDGLASATVFTQMLRMLRRDDALSFAYRSCGYGPKMSAVPADWLSGDLNAILDFRYTESDRLTYFFDHHVTGFGSPEEEAQARRAVAESRAHVSPRGPRSLHFDASYGSCTKLIRDVARTEYGVTLDGLDELVFWADRIDAARFESAEDALADTPAQRLAQIVEQHGDADFLTRLVPLLGSQSLADVADAPLQAQLFATIAAGKEQFKNRVRDRAENRGDVVVVDLSDEVVSAAGKFVTYALFPSAIYSVAILRTKQLIKVGVGYNPWCGKPRRHDISALCKREGGGGHVVVGAASFPTNAREKAQAAAMRIVRALEA